MASGVQKQKSSWGLIILLLIVLIFGIFVLLPSTNTGINTSTQTTTENQCPQAGQNFDARQEAFTLAQSAEQYRKIKPYGGNYGLGSYIICFTDGTEQRVQSIPFPGKDNYQDPTKPLNYTHSEQSAYGWLQRQLSTLSIDRSNITAIYTVIFSQVIVCDSCAENMKSWQRTLRQKAGIETLFLSIWDISRKSKKGFDPYKFPAGNGKPITIDDLENVEIEFY